MNIVHLIADINTVAAGPSYSVPRLIDHLVPHNSNVTLATLSNSAQVDAKSFIKFFPTTPLLGSIGGSMEMKKWLFTQSTNSHLDIVHAHSLWRMPIIYPSQLKRSINLKYILSPRGTLSRPALSIHSFRKKIFAYCVQNAALKRVDCFHATGMNELEDIRSHGFTQPICVIPNGIDVVNDICKSHSKNEKTMLFFGRIHPIKGIENLLLTWKRIFPVHRDWILRIVGPGDLDYINSLRNYSYSLSNERVYFESPVYGFNKYNLFSSCDLFVLPSYSENFGMTVAESLMCKTPVVVTKNSPWQGLEATGSGWWIDNDPQSLFYTIDAAMNLSDSERYMMGVRGRNWMINDFSWYEVAKQFQLVYMWLNNQGKVPECVHF